MTIEAITTHECYDLDNLNAHLEDDKWKEKDMVRVRLRHGEWDAGDGWYEGQGLGRIVFCPFCGEKLPNAQ